MSIDMNAAGAPYSTASYPELLQALREKSAWAREQMRFLTDGVKKAEEGKYWNLPQLTDVRDLITATINSLRAWNEEIEEMLSEIQVDGVKEDHPARLARIARSAAEMNTVQYATFKKDTHLAQYFGDPSFRSIETLYAIGRDAVGEFTNMDSLGAALRVYCGKKAQVESSGEGNVVNIHGVSIFLETKTVQCLGYKQTYRTGGLPWTIFRRCAEETPDELGKVSLENLSRSKVAVNNELHRINQKWEREIGRKLLHVRDGYVHLERRHSAE